MCMRARQRQPRCRGPAARTFLSREPRRVSTRLGFLGSQVACLPPNLPQQIPTCNVGRASLRRVRPRKLPRTSVSGSEFPGNRSAPVWSMYMPWHIAAVDRIAQIRSVCEWLGQGAGARMCRSRWLLPQRFDVAVWLPEPRQKRVLGGRRRARRASPTARTAPPPAIHPGLTWEPQRGRGGAEISSQPPVLEQFVISS